MRNESPDAIVRSRLYTRPGTQAQPSAAELERDTPPSEQASAAIARHTLPAHVSEEDGLRILHEEGVTSYLEGERLLRRGLTDAEVRLVTANRMRYQDESQR